MKPESLLCGVVIACGAASLYALFKLIYFAFRRCGVGYEPLGVFCGGLALSLSLKCLLSPVIVAVLDAYDQNLWMWGLVTLFFPMIDVVIGGGVFLAAYLCCGAINWRQVRNEAQKCNYRLKGVVLVVLCGACWLLALILLAVNFEDFAFLVDVRLWSLVVVSFSMMGLSRRYFRYAKIVHEGKRTLDALSVGNAPILFLRSFQLDQQVGNACLDEELCRGFSLTDVPVISLCDPSEDVPSGGSIKLRARDDGWKEMVRKLLPICRAVVMFEGVTDGLNWEVDTLRSLVSPGRFFLATPPEKYRVYAWFSCPSWLVGLHRVISQKGIAAAYEFVWGRFRSRLLQVGIAIPEKPVQGDRIISFGEDWQYRRIITPKRKMGLFEEVLSLTRKGDGTKCDYGEIAKLIKPYEVGETVPSEAYDRVRRFARRIIITFFALTAAIVALIAIVGNVAVADDGDLHGDNALSCLSGMD